MIDIEKKFKKVMSKQELDRLQDIAIFQNPNGTYEVFNSYLIDKKPEGAIVKLFNGDIINSFYNLKNAMCWCIFDKRGRYGSADRIVELDLKLSAIEVNMTMHQKLFKKSKDADTRLIYLAKLNEDKHKKRQMTDELNAYLMESNSWQQRSYKLKTDNKAKSDK
jgi:hypothetical protein